MGAYKLFGLSGWVLIQRWVVNRINMVHFSEEIITEIQNLQRALI